MIRENRTAKLPPVLAKLPTGITGLDEITRGGIPVGRTTLVCGGPGCGKTILALEFLVHGALVSNEPGLFVSFEEKPKHLAENFRSFGYDLDDLAAKGLLRIAYVDLARSEIYEAGPFSLDGLLIRLKHDIAETGAKRVVLDTLETLFSALSRTPELRSEVARIFHWLREAGITAIVTGEGGGDRLTLEGFEEFIADCVIRLDHRVSEQNSKRRLRIVKYRGSGHASDEFPFFIGKTGFSVTPITSLGLDYGASDERVSSGVNGLDRILGGEGYFRGTSVLVSGDSGTGKSSLAAAFLLAAINRGERCLYFSFEESVAQVTRNMNSIGIDLGPGQASGLLTICSLRPTFRGLEEHLISMVQEVEEIEPSCAVIDPITSFVDIGDDAEVKSMLIRIMDFLKRRGITVVMAALNSESRRPGRSTVYLSSLVDTWIEVDMERIGRKRRRTIHVIKSRGLEHSHETHQFGMSPGGLSVFVLEETDHDRQTVS